MRELEYKVVAGEEIRMSELGAYGFKLMVAVDHELDKEARYELSRITRSVEEVLQRSLYNTPERKMSRAEIGAKERERVLSVFGDEVIYVEEIPNGYCSKPCCSHRPWFWVTTKVGHFQIGWRKRVLVVDWKRTTCKTSAEDLFPNENVTKYEQLIHAWSYDDARKYVQQITAEATNG